MNVVRVIDFETTGTEPPQAEVCEVGICDLDVEARTVSHPRSWLCRVLAMPPEARAVHHIAARDTFSSEPFNEEDLGQDEVTAIAAHNADFETKFFTPKRPVICTYKAALRVWPEAPSHGNMALRYWLEDQVLVCPREDLAQPAHRAGPDAYVTAFLLVALLEAGATGKDMVAWTREPALLPSCPIGKFRGKPWADVETGFLSWMTRQESMEADLKWNAQRELDRRHG